MNYGPFGAHSVRRNSSSAFTLIELLVVIAIIAILAIVVVLVLNPGQLLAQARDSTRLQDLATLSSALNVAASENFTAAAWGQSSTTYLSVIDPTATSTNGTDCTGIGLAVPVGSSIQNHCAASSTEARPDGTGWIPVNLSKLSTGSPIGSLPVDPINTTSSNSYYTYQPGGTSGRYKLTAFLESQKYATQMAVDGGVDAALYETGNAITLPSAGRGLVGYWPFDEGGGSSAFDSSGGGHTGTWLSTGPHYAAGRVGSGAGQFNGGVDYVQIPNGGALSVSSFSISMWLNATILTGAFTEPLFSSELYPTNGFRMGVGGTHKITFWSTEDAGTVSAVAPNPIVTNSWYHLTVTYDGSLASIYVNGVLVSTSSGNIIPSNANVNIGSIAGFSSWTGYIDDVRLYNRALSAAEIQALYNAEK
jgi:prepilin-type N-terminal cleavage/methylation domain-containing protein